MCPLKDHGHGKTELVVTEYGWTAGPLMQRSTMGLEQCLDKMAARLAARKSCGLRSELTG